MYNINNLMAIEVDKQIIKFESLIVYNNFIALRNEITFKDIEKEISKLILKEFDKYYDDNNIQNLQDYNILNNLIDNFLPHIINHKKINKELVNLYQFIINADSEFNSIKAINLFEKDFVDEILRVYFFKILKIRQKFYQ